MMKQKIFKNRLLGFLRHSFGPEMFDPCQCGSIDFTVLSFYVLVSKEYRFEIAIEVNCPNCSVQRTLKY